MIKNTTKNKLNQLYKTVEQNLVDVNRLNHLKKFTFHPEHFFKYVYLLELEREYLLPFDFPQRFTQEYSFTNMPDWVLASSQIIPKIYSTSAYQITKYISYDTHFHWKQIESDSYLLQVTLRVEAYEPITLIPLSLLQIPVYVDLDIIFHNNKELYEISHPKIQI